MITLRVSGEADLREVQLQLLREAMALDRNCVQAAEKGMAGFGPHIVEAAPTYLPDRYAPVFAGDIRVQTFVHLAVMPSVRVRVYAHGVRGSRDVRAVNAGRVRHPLFANRNHWYETRARRGVITTEFRRMRPELVEAINEELENVAQRVAKV